MRILEKNDQHYENSQEYSFSRIMRNFSLILENSHGIIGHSRENLRSLLYQGKFICNILKKHENMF